MTNFTQNLSLLDFIILQLHSAMWRLFTKTVYGYIDNTSTKMYLTNLNGGQKLTFILKGC